MRNWYQAKYEPGLPAEERHVKRMVLRDHLLTMIRLNQFPQCGNNVSGMSLTMFEGLLTNIDRRIQLYALSKSGTYNHFCKQIKVLSQCMYYIIIDHWSTIFKIFSLKKIIK